MNYSFKMFIVPAALWAVLLNSCGCASNSPILMANKKQEPPCTRSFSPESRHPMPQVCLEKWSVPKVGSAVLTGEVTNRAMEPIYKAIRDTVCHCFDTCAISTIPQSISFAIVSNPNMGMASAKVVATSGESSKSPGTNFLDCIGTIKAKFGPWHLGSCTDPENGTGLLHMSLTVDLSHL